MLNKAVVRKFRNRSLDDFTWLKELSRDDLLQEVYEMAGDDCFITDPYTHQLVCFLLGIVFPEFLFLLDMGLGKSKISVDLINYRKNEGELKRALIVPPTVANVDDWLDEVGTHAPSLKAVGLFGDTEEKLDTILSSQDADVFIISYPALRFLLTSLVRGRKGKNNFKPDKKAIRAFVKLFNFMVLDESHFCKNHKSLTYRLCNQISLKCDFRYGLTGTPFGRDPTALWSQFKLIDRGDALGKTLGLFREAFFKTRLNHFSGFDEYVFDHKNEDLLYQTLRHRSIYYEDKECVDIPKEKRIVVRVPFPDVNYEYYKKMLDNLRNARGDKKKQSDSFIRMRQISSGFVGIIGKDSNKIEMEFPYNPKLERLQEIVESLPLNRKMIIFYEFVRSSSMIVNMLKKIKVNHAFYTKGRKEEIVKFKKDPSCRILVVTNKILGLNLQVANYEAYFESPVSPISRKQSERRATGARQKKYKRVYIYDLVTDNSVDQDILDFIAEGKDLFDAIVKGKHVV